MRTNQAAPLCLLLLAACAPQQLAEGETTGQHEDPYAPTEAALLVDPTNTMVFTAHEDDDFLFTPDTTYTLRKNPNAKLIGVTLTAGDADFSCLKAGVCDDSYIVGREKGQLAGYAKLLGVSYPDNTPEAIYTTDTLTLNGKTIRRWKMNNGKVDLLYLGFPSNNRDPNLMSLWQAPSASHTIYTLGPTPRATGGGAVGGCDRRRPSESYTRSELIETLRQIMELYRTPQVNTMDSGRLWPETYPFEHVDHSAVSLFALAASQRYAAPHALRTYRTYNINVIEPANVATVDAEEKLTFLGEYGKYDRWMFDCQFGTFSYCGKTDVCQDPGLFWGGFEDRQYSIAPVQGTGITGAIASPSDSCLRASSVAAGASVALAACAFPSAAQEWTLSADGTIRPASAPSLCLTAAGASTSYRFQSPAPAAPSLRLQSCSAAGTAPAADQQFLLMSNGQLRGPDSSCVETAGATLLVKECRNAAAQLGFRVQFYPHPHAAAHSGYGESASEIPNRFDVYHAISYGDLDGTAPRRADVCVRRANGIWCSKSIGGSFDAPVRFSADFADSATLGTPAFRGNAYGSTVQLADLDGDGKADVCGRAADGVYCALGTGTSFQAARKWSAGSDFGDQRSYGSSEGYYGSLHFPDVNNDGRADACARNARGIECALNEGGGFAAATQWLSEEFTDDLLWNTASYGGTVQFPDVDGDGFPEVCGRARDGIRCAVNNYRFDADPHFVTPHLFGASSDFDDLSGWGASRSYYGSIHFADINGDRRADVCGRGINGVVCGISMGSSFSQAQRMIPVNPLADPSWSPDRYGSTLQLADIDGDGHADVCARGPLPNGSAVGLTCALAP